ncbi:MAG: tRNA (adenosine(37)-N6)-threonylcarbamoyltransferase complex dimerization subunit type 1 TsaB [Candidatus Aminicenantes bacterium]|nr:tRNA (adenosine(37)-N6)-threonylcarbamoyltransferase complex dimerization subunit type 1 TsaB [Candidatus Aminicenantes bacterium]
MLILAVDTTTPAGSVALLRDGALLAECNAESGLTHSERLLATVDAVLAAAKATLADVDAFAVAAGPGSFTGIRIGLGTVKSFCFASGKPGLSVSTLEALALKGAVEGGRLIAPMLDAKKGEVYAALFAARGEALVEIVPQGAYRPEAFLARLPARRVIRLLGNGALLYRDQIAARLGRRGLVVARTPFIGHEVGRLGFAALAAGKGVPGAALQPFYHRKSQAEE